MADGTSVLREYLISIGFRVNQTEGKKVEKNLDNWDKKAVSLAKGLLGASAAVTTMVTTFAFQMEKLYYASRRVDSTAGSIKALDYGARQVGVQNITQSMEALARNLRSNPGLTGLLNSLGVRVSGRDKADVMVDLVTQLKKMPFFVAERFANLFGIDPDTLFMLQDGLDRLKESQALRKQMAAEMGVDTEAAAKSGLEYAQLWREIVERGGLFVDLIATKMLPSMTLLAGETNKLLTTWAQIVNMQPSQFWQDMWDGLFAEKVGRVQLSEDAKKRLAMDAGQRDGYGGVELSGDAKQRLGSAPLSTSTQKGWFRQKYEAAMRALGAKGYQPGAGDERSIDAATADTGPARGTQATAGGTGAGTLADGGPAPRKAGAAERARQEKAAQDAAPLFARLEKQYGLPPGMLGRVWAQESNRGGNMLSSAGAQGHFQFMPETAKQYGLSDPNSLDQSASAAAKMYGYLLKKYDGDERKAAAAYNWGEGRVDRYGLGRAPAETRGYMDAVASPASGGINQTNHITVQGVKDPDKAAEAVKNSVDAANSDIIRNQRPKVQ
ncbi:membrane-bound lytic murein transglycosylase D [compost metagenome]